MTDPTPEDHLNKMFGDGLSPFEQIMNHLHTKQGFVVPVGVGLVQFTSALHLARSIQAEAELEQREKDGLN